MPRKIECREIQGSVTLYGQLSLKPYFCTLPAPAGARMKYEICVETGRIRFNHTSFNEDGGTWSCDPKGGQQAHYNVTAGETRTIILVVGESWGNPDHVDIVNPSMRANTKFSYQCTYLTD